MNGQRAEQLSLLELEKGIRDGQIYGGMVPKVEAVIKCLDLDIDKVIIADQTLTGTRCYKEAITA
jgi:acetylglutamate kinase